MQITFHVKCGCILKHSCYVGWVWLSKLRVPGSHEGLKIETSPHCPLYSSPCLKSFSNYPVTHPDVFS